RAGGGYRGDGRVSWTTTEFYLGIQFVGVSRWRFARERPEFIPANRAGLQSPRGSDMALLIPKSESPKSEKATRVPPDSSFGFRPSFGLRIYPPPPLR